MTSSNLPEPSAINEAHRLARQSAETAMQYAIRCGDLLIEVKASLPHGQFGAWIANNCDFSRATAGHYMKAARNPNALGIGAVRRLYASGQQSRGAMLPPPQPDWIPDPGVLAIARNLDATILVRRLDRDPDFCKVAVIRSGGPDAGGMAEYTNRGIRADAVSVFLLAAHIHAAEDLDWDHLPTPWPLDWLDVQ